MPERIWDPSILIGCLTSDERNSIMNEGPFSPEIINKAEQN